MLRPLACLALVLALACAGGGAPDDPDRRRDAGGTRDAGGGVDAGSVRDAGGGGDAGGGVDAAPAPDGGACPDGLTRCGGACLDLTSEPSSCGVCGRACIAPTGGTAECRSGSCVGVCPDGQTDCSGTCRATGQSCAVGEGLCRREGVTICAPDGTTCGVTPGAPGAEVCSGADEDCDGEVDEGTRATVRGTSYTALSARHPGCTAATRFGPDCNAAIHRECDAVGGACGNSGFGPVENAGDSATTVCAEVDVLESSFAQLSAELGPCDGASAEGIHSAACNAAIHRWCRGRGYVSGFGPLEHAAPGAAFVACTRLASVMGTSYTALSTHHPSCDGSSERFGRNCNAAIHRFCRSMGFVSGFGPVENSGDTAFVACVSD